MSLDLILLSIGGIVIGLVCLITPIIIICEERKIKEWQPKPMEL
jgi:hypothetical protein